MVFLFVITWILLDAVSDGLYDNSKKVASEIVMSVILAGLLVALYFLSINISFSKFLIGYVFVRFLLFDYAYNITRGLKWDYVGTSKIYDKLLGWVKDMWGSGSVLFIKVILGIVGICFLLGIE